MTHEYRRFVQQELDARGWEPPELVRRSGLHRQLVWKILHDDRDYLVQMPDEGTLEALARGFGIPVDRVRIAAARSIDGYTDGDGPLMLDVTQLPNDVLIEELRRRISSASAALGKQPEQAPTWGSGIRPGPTGKDARVRRNQQSG